jgi:sec-independent protein translocase protein TatA
MIGPWEWVLIILLVLLIFGAKKLPEMGKGLAQGIRVFKKELSDDDASKEKDEADTDEKSQEGS